MRSAASQSSPRSGSCNNQRISHSVIDTWAARHHSRVGIEADAAKQNTALPVHHLSRYSDANDRVVEWPWEQPITPHVPPVPPALQRECEAHSPIADEGGRGNNDGRGMHGTDPLDLSIVEKAIDSLRDAVETNSSHVLTLRGEVSDLQRAMWPLSNGVGITEEPAWIKASKGDLQTTFREELSEMFHGMGPKLPGCKNALAKASEVNGPSIALACELTQASRVDIQMIIKSEMQVLTAGLKTWLESLLDSSGRLGEEKIPPGARQVSDVSARKRFIESPRETDQVLFEIQYLKEIVVQRFAEVRRDLARCESFGECSQPNDKSIPASVRANEANTSIRQANPLSLHAPAPSNTKSTTLTSLAFSSEGMPANTGIRHSTRMSLHPPAPSRTLSTTLTSLAIVNESKSCGSRGVWDLRRRIGSKDEKAALKCSTADTKDMTLTLGRLDPEHIKQKVREAKMQYLQKDTHLMYHKEGCFSKIASHQNFEHVTLVVIVANAIWMGFDTNTNGHNPITEVELANVLAHVFFYTYFLIELLIRFVAFERKKDAFHNMWFVFDATLVFSYTLDPFLMGLIELVAGSAKLSFLAVLPTDVLRVLRLARLSRLTRLLRYFPELKIIIKGLATALATVGYSVGLLGCITYVFALAIRNLTPAHSDIERQYFPTVLETMHHLLIYGAFMDSLSGFILQIKSESVVVMVLAWLYIALSALLLMNMLIGILCEVTSAVATEEKEIMMVHRVHSQFMELIKKFDGNDKGSLTWEEFADLLSDEKCGAALMNVDVDSVDLIDMVEDIFFYGHDCDCEVELKHEELIELLLDLRGSKMASVKDVMAIGKRFTAKCHDMKQMLDCIALKLDGENRVEIIPPSLSISMPYGSHGSECPEIKPVPDSSGIKLETTV